MRFFKSDIVGFNTPPYVGSVSSFSTGHKKWQTKVLSQVLIADNVIMSLFLECQ